MAEVNGQHEPATPQEIWEILRKVSAAQQETDQLLKRQARAADRRMQETNPRQNYGERRWPIDLQWSASESESISTPIFVPSSGTPPGMTL